MNPVAERISGSLHMQLLSGCPAAVYWMGSYIWDMGSHLLITLASLAIFAAFDDKVSCGAFCMQHSASFRHLPLGLFCSLWLMHAGFDIPK